MLGVEQAAEVTDLDEVRHVLSAAYGQLRIDGAHERARMRLESQPLGAVRLDRLGVRFRFTCNVEPLYSHAFGYLEEGRVRVCSDGEERFVEPGGAFLVVAPEHSYRAELDHALLTSVMLSQAVVDEVADGVRFTDYRPISLEKAVRWRSTCEYIRDEVLPAFAESPLVVANATRLLVATTIATFPIASIRRAADQRDAHPQTLKRAIAFIEDNAADDITAADIAYAARVSIRAIQLAFRRHLDTTPMAYLRRVRLSCADADLRAAKGTVTEIAARWGYARPSVFAAHYRTAYGVPPSHTLWSG